MGKIVWIELAAEMRNSYHTSKEISEEISKRHNTEITPARVRAWLSENGYKPRTKQDWLLDNKETVELLLDNGESVSFLSTQFNISTKEIYKFLRNNEISSPGSRLLSAVKNKMESFPDSWFLDQINNCVSISDIAKKTGTSTTSVYKRMKSAGLKPYRKYENWAQKQAWILLKKKNSDGDSINQYFLKEAFKKIYHKNPVSFITPDQARDFISNHCPPGGLIVEPLVWTGSLALGALASNYRYSGCVHSPYLYTGIQEMFDFLELREANIQYGEFSEDRKPNLIVAEIPGLSVRMEQILTTKNWCRQFLVDIFKYAESSGADKVALIIPKKIRALVPSTHGMPVVYQ